MSDTTVLTELLIRKIKKIQEKGMKHARLADRANEKEE